MAEGNRLLSGTEFQQALRESENRRKVLLQTLQETQETIKLQSLRLDEGERLAKEQQKELDKVKNKERDYQRYITNLERQLTTGKQRQEAQLKILQEAENKFELLEGEASTLRSSIARLQGECKHKEDKLKASSSRLQELEEENASLVAELESANQKLLTQHESLASLREDNAFLDKQAKSEALDAEQLRKENASLFADVKQLRKQVTTLSEKSSSYMKESSLLTSQLQASSAEERRLKGQLAELQKINGELKDIFSSFASEKDRFFREKLEHHSQIQNLTTENDNLFRERLLADDQANELSSELAQVKRLANKLAEENKRLTGELNEIRKVHESRSFEAFNARYKLDQQRDQLQSSEQRKLIASQQHDLFKDEIRCLEQRLLDCQKMLKAADGDKNSAVIVKDELITELQNDVEKLTEEKHSLKFQLEIQKDVAEAGNLKRKQECICKCHDGQRKEGGEDNCDGSSRKGSGKDICEEFEAQPRQENTREFHFAAIHSRCADISRNKQMVKTSSSDKEEMQSNKPPIKDIFCETCYAENKRGLDLSCHRTPKYSEQHLASQFETSEIKPDDKVPAYDLLGLGPTNLSESKTMLADDKTGETAAKTDLPNDRGSRKKVTAPVRSEESIGKIKNLMANSSSDKKAELWQMDSLENNYNKGGQNESIAISAAGTKPIRQEDTVTLEEDNCKMEIYVCVADDQEEKFFEDGSAAFLVLLPPNSRDVSLINDSSVDLEHQENAVAKNSLTGDKDESKPQINLPNDKKIVENRAQPSDVQVYRLTSDDNKLFRNHFAGQNILEELTSPETPLCAATETSTLSKNFASAEAIENIQPCQAVQDIDAGQTFEDNEASYIGIHEIGVKSDSGNTEDNE